MRYSLPKKQLGNLTRRIVKKGHFLNEFPPATPTCLQSTYFFCNLEFCVESQSFNIDRKKWCNSSFDEFHQIFDREYRIFFKRIIKFDESLKLEFAELFFPPNIMSLAMTASVIEVKQSQIVCLVTKNTSRFRGTPFRYKLRLILIDHVKKIGIFFYFCNNKFCAWHICSVISSEHCVNSKNSIGIIFLLAWKKMEEFRI